jgi:hypothetical protein
MKASKIRLAGTFALILALTFAVSGCSNSGTGSDSYPKTSKYLYSKFENGQFIAPYKKGNFDLGATMEAAVGLEIVGVDKAKFSKTVDWLKANASKLSGTGLKGQYIFTAFILGFASDPSVNSTLEDLKKSIAPDSSLKDSTNIDYCWAILGLVAAGEGPLANKLALKLTTLNELIGGFKYIQNDPQSPILPFVTAFAAMSIASTQGLGTSQDEAAKTFAAGKAKSWLLINLNGADHWISDGGDDMSGTAYAIMALKALGEDTSKYRSWYASQINTQDNGVIAPFTDPESDVFTTSQSILALNNISFIDVLKNIQK